MTTWLHNPLPHHPTSKRRASKFWEESCMHAFLVVSFMRARSRRTGLLGGIDGRAFSEWVICTVVSLHVPWTHPAYNNHHLICSTIMFKPLRVPLPTCALGQSDGNGAPVFFFIYFISVWSFWHSDEWKWRGLTICLFIYVATSNRRFYPSPF